MLTNNHLFAKIHLSTKALRCVERLIHTHLLDLLDREIEFLSLYETNDNQKYQFFGEHKEFPSLMDTVETLRCAEKVARKYKEENHAKSPTRTPSHQRMFSEPAIFISSKDLLTIDDPVEDEDGADGWYFGGRSQSPPAVASDDPILNNVINVTKPSVGSRHRRTFSTGVVDSPLSSRQSGGANSIYPSRSAKDSSLFRLIVTLQLCLVRIEEANSVLCKGKAQPTNLGRRERLYSDLDLIRTCTSSNSFDCDSTSSAALQNNNKVQDVKSWKMSRFFAISLGLGVTYYSSTGNRVRNMTTSERMQLLKSAGKFTAGLFTIRFVRSWWRQFCLNARVSNSSEAVQDWIFQWICLVNENAGASTDRQLFVPEKVSWRSGMFWFLAFPPLSHSLFLVQYNSWYSFGSVRFQLIKRGMDLFYASIGKAIELTRGQQENEEEASLDARSSGLWTYVVASLAASYYNVIGPAAKSAQVVSSSSKSVIQNAWGVVSLPAVKKASLEATRILKGE